MTDKKKRVPTEVPLLIVIEGETWRITPKLRKILLNAKKKAPHMSYREILILYLGDEL